MNFARYCWLNASKFPEREFIIESYPSKRIRKALTWKQLNDQTNKLANFMMKECGVKKGDIVGCANAYESPLASLLNHCERSPLAPSNHDRAIRIQYPDPP